jgi:putative tryptophan/tyrosine transport system substrate-binding protein
MLNVKRREFITLVGGGGLLLATKARRARAQQPAVPVIGFLGSASPDRWVGRMRAFHQGLSETGYAESRNVAMEYRWAKGQNDQLGPLAAELVSRQVTVIVAPGSTPAALAAKAATTTIPIVFEVASDPVELGLVISLARPGGNITGVISLNAEVAPKRLELLHELVPTAAVVGLLVNPTNPNLADFTTKNLRAAARSLGLEMHVLHASAERDFEPVFATLLQLRAGALVIGADPFFTSRLEQLAALTLRHAVPTVYQFREFTAAGGLMSYGGSLTDTFRAAGVYTGRILRGDKPAELPVQQTTKVELFLNLKTAKVLGLEVPPMLLARADEVIE